MQFDVTKQAVLRNDDIEIVFLDAKNLHLHNHVALECLWGFSKQVEEDLSIFHDSLRISSVPKAAHELTFDHIVIEVLIVLEFPLNPSDLFWIFEDVDEDDVLIGKPCKLLFVFLDIIINTYSLRVVSLLAFASTNFFVIFWYHSSGILVMSSKLISSSK